MHEDIINKMLSNSLVSMEDVKVGTELLCIYDYYDYVQNNERSWFGEILKITSVERDLSSFDVKEEYAEFSIDIDIDTANGLNTWDAEDGNYTVFVPVRLISEQDVFMSKLSGDWKPIAKKLRKSAMEVMRLDPKEVTKYD